VLSDVPPSTFLMLMVGALRLILRTRCGLQDLGSRSLLGLRTRWHFWEPGPRLGFGALGRFQDLDSESFLTLWPFHKIWVLGSRSVCRSSLQCLRLLWFWPLCDQYHDHDFSFSRDVEQQMLTRLQSHHDW
jgi:hypothetical protein